jgi:CDP-diacylglycerol pyrophosphatase
MQVCFADLLRLSLLLLIPLWFGTGHARAADPDILWKIVHDKCVPGEATRHDPFPCESVDISHGTDAGFVVLKDLAGRSQFLLIPTAKISGIESPLLRAPDAANYFQDAWRARDFVERRMKTALPRDAISLAINSMSGRSQNQLHIHVDCIRTDVRAVLRAHQEAIEAVWADFPARLAGRHYRAMRIPSASLGGVNPFKLLAEGIPGAASEMGRYTLVVVGATFAGGVDGFILLADRADLAVGDRGSGENLQDHDCHLADTR